MRALKQKSAARILEEPPHREAAPELVRRRQGQIGVVDHGVLSFQ